MLDNSYKVKYPTVKRIFIADPESLVGGPKICGYFQTDFTIASPDSLEEIEFIPPASFEYSTDSKGEKTAKIKFATHTHRFISNNYAIIVECMTGEMYMVGNGLYPYPGISLNFTTGETPADKSVFSYEIEWQTMPLRVFSSC